MHKASTAAGGPTPTLIFAFWHSPALVWVQNEIALCAFLDCPGAPLLWGRAEGPHLKKIGAAVGQGRRPAPEFFLGLLWGRAEGPHLASQVAFPEPENLASIAGLDTTWVYGICLATC